MLVQDNLALHRYEATDGDDLAGFITYRVRDGRHWLDHTELSESHRGTGVGAFLVRKTLDDLRSKSALVIPACPFIAAWISRHPDYQDLVDAEIFHEFKRSRGRGRRRTVSKRAGSGSTVSTPCRHVPEALESLPGAWPVDGCAECLAVGHRQWVHLRVCQGCGHVGCCDDSPGKHGTSHAEQAAHPLIRSYEPSENWWYCYLDTSTFQVEGAPPAPSHD
jgi:predicted GNAT family acetyltransferase